MFQNIWDLIQDNQLEKANKQLSSLNLEYIYLLNVSKIFQAELALYQKEFTKSIQIANEIYPYFNNLDQNRDLKDLYYDSTGIGLAFLESCFINWIYARNYAGLLNWKESRNFANEALKKWDFFKVSREPFLKDENVKEKWKQLPLKIKAHIDFLDDLLGIPPFKDELLELLVPENFTPSKDKPKMNTVSSHPLVSICIASYHDGEWLQMTVDSVLADKSYDNIEIIIVLQRDENDLNDTTGQFLESETYRKNPKIKVMKFGKILGADGAKQICYENSSGELIISFDGHIIPCQELLSKTVKVFLDNREVSLFSYGIIDTYNDQTLKNFFFNEIPFLLCGIIGTKPIYENQEIMISSKPGLYEKQAVMGAAFCITRKLFEELGGYLLKDRSWGDKAMSMSAYLYGYKTYTSLDLICIHRVRLFNYPNMWQEPVQFGEYVYENLAISALTICYFYHSQKYFEKYLIPLIKMTCGESAFAKHWQNFETLLPELKVKKEKFWEKAVCSMREYWLEYGDYIWARLSDAERHCLYRRSG